MKDEYKRIGCSVYDRYEAFAATRKLLDIVYLDKEGNQVVVQNSRIIDLFTVSKEEFMKLEGDITFRLDKIISLAEVSS